MNAFETLRSEPLPIPAHRIAFKTGQRHEEVYAELVSLEAKGMAKPVFNGTHAAGWVYVEAL